MCQKIFLTESKMIEHMHSIHLDIYDEDEAQSSRLQTVNGMCGNCPLKLSISISVTLNFLSLTLCVHFLFDCRLMLLRNDAHILCMCVCVCASISSYFCNQHHHHHHPLTRSPHSAPVNGFD